MAGWWPWRRAAGLPLLALAAYRDGLHPEASPSLHCKRWSLTIPGLQTSRPRPPRVDAPYPFRPRSCRSAARPVIRCSPHASVAPPFGNLFFRAPAFTLYAFSGRRLCHLPRPRSEAATCTGAWVRLNFHAGGAPRAWNSRPRARPTASLFPNWRLCRDLFLAAVHHWRWLAERRPSWSLLRQSLLKYGRSRGWITPNPSVLGRHFLQATAFEIRAIGSRPTNPYDDPARPHVGGWRRAVAWYVVFGVVLLPLAPRCGLRTSRDVDPRQHTSTSLAFLEPPDHGAELQLRMHVDQGALTLSFAGLSGHIRTLQPTDPAPGDRAGFRVCELPVSENPGLWCSKLLESFRSRRLRRPQWRSLSSLMAEAVFHQDIGPSRGGSGWANNPRWAMWNGD